MILYALRLTDAAGQPLTDAGRASVFELISGDLISSAAVDANGFTPRLPLQTGVPYRVTTASAIIPTAIVMPGAQGIILVNPDRVANAAGVFGFATPFEEIIPFELLAAFVIVPATSSGGWLGTVTDGGMSDQWLANENGAQWLSEGALTVPLKAAALKDAGYWRVEMNAVATITIGDPNVPVGFHAFSILPVETTYDLDDQIAEAPQTTISARTVVIVDAAAANTQIGFQFSAPTDPAIACTAILGEITIRPYKLQGSQAK